MSRKDNMLVMSEANNIKNYSAEDIRRYWNNEMSAQEMHALEIAAMEDPFLADALEGYSKLEKDPSNDLALLKRRIAESAATAPVVTMKRRNQWLRVAAIFILLAGLGVVGFKLMQQNKNDLAKNDSPKANAAPPAQENTAANQSTDQYRTEDSSHAVYDTVTVPSYDLAASPPKKELKTLKPVGKSEAISSGIAKADVRDDKDSLIAKEVIENRQSEYKKSAAPAAAEKSESLDRYASRAKLDTNTVNANAGEPQGRKQDAEQVFLYNTFSGKVVDLQNRSIPYAQVRMNNANQLAATDQYGMFQFRSRDSVADITIASPGYQEKNLTLNSNQSGLITMERQPSKSKLSEVIVSGNGAARKKSAKAPDLHVYVMDAEPVIGWDKYNRYLDSNKKIPADEPRLQGEVVLSFKVSSKGELSSFDVEHSLSKSYDKEAIRLIKEGPGWRVTNGKKTRVKVIVRF